MAFDLAKVPGGDVGKWGSECRDRAVGALAEGDWRGIYDWTKSWIGWGGGAWLPDTWLLYAVSALIHGQPRAAVNSFDLGLKTWLTGAVDRSAIVWCRGMLVWKQLDDPKTALADLETASELLPAWVGADPSDGVQLCRAAARASRKRVPTVQPRPDHVGPGGKLHVVAPPAKARDDGDRPDVWPTVTPYFVG